MNFEEARPFVRYARLFCPMASIWNEKVYAPDCRFFWVQEGVCTFMLDRLGMVRMEAGDCLLIPSGIPYLIHPPKEKMLFYGVNFDYTWERSDLSGTLPRYAPNEDAEIIPMPYFADCPTLSQPLYVRGMALLEPALREMAEEFFEQRMYYQSRMSSLMQGVLTQIARTQLSDHVRHPEAVQMMMRYIQEHCTHSLANAEIAESVNYHPNYANRLFLQHTGQTLHQYVIACRVRMALDALYSTEDNMTEIASRCGFSSLNRFTKEFTRQIGSAPSRFRGRKRRHE